MKATAVAPSNIAFIKYWGKQDETLRIPENGSISMNLSRLLTTTTVQFSAELAEDRLTIDGQSYPPDSIQAGRVTAHLDRIRRRAGLSERASVVSQNNFPSGTGLSSSASAFAALTVAAAAAAGLRLSERELSRLARLGSGSACRSIPDGFVEWLPGDSHESSYAVSLYPPDYWDIVDVVAVVSVEKKEVSSTRGQQAARSSPFFPVRLARIGPKIETIKGIMARRDFPAFGELVEAEAIELHAIMLTSTPSLIYWFPESLKLMRLVRQWRAEGLPVYFTVNTGQDVHLICQKSVVPALTDRLQDVPELQQMIINEPAQGVRLIDAHLF